MVAHAPDRPLSPDDRELADQLAGLCGLILTYRRNQLAHELLIGELRHRVGNLFSTIGAVVYATLKSHPEPAAFRKTFDGRLMALARAHAIAIEAGETDLRQLLADALPGQGTVDIRLADTLAPYAVDHEVRLDGPVWLLPQEAAVAFSLAAHELATNAAKYGALSVPGGSVSIDWDVAADEDHLFRLTWRESGGPTVSPPSRQGYGQKTLHRSMARSSWTIDLKGWCAACPHPGPRVLASASISASAANAVQVIPAPTLLSSARERGRVKGRRARHGRAAGAQREIGPQTPGFGS